MKVKTTVKVMSSRAYSFADRETKENVNVVEVFFTDGEGQMYKTTRRGTEALEVGDYDVVINIKPNQKLAPSIGVIEF